MRQPGTQKTPKLLAVGCVCKTIYPGVNEAIEHAQYDGGQMLGGTQLPNIKFVEDEGNLVWDETDTKKESHNGAHTTQLNLKVAPSVECA